MRASKAFMDPPRSSSADAARCPPLCWSTAASSWTKSAHALWIGEKQFGGGGVRHGHAGQETSPSEAMSMIRRCMCGRGAEGSANMCTTCRMITCRFSSSSSKTTAASATSTTRRAAAFSWASRGEAEPLQVCDSGQLSIFELNTRIGQGVGAGASRKRLCWVRQSSLEAHLFASRSWFNNVSSPSSGQCESRGRAAWGARGGDLAVDAPRDRAKRLFEKLDEHFHCP